MKKLNGAKVRTAAHDSFGVRSSQLTTEETQKKNIKDFFTKYTVKGANSDVRKTIKQFG